MGTTAKEVLETLISDMQTQQQNMDWLIKDANQKIIKAIEDDSRVGKLNKKDIIIQQLEHEQYVNAQKSVYQVLEEWGMAYLRELRASQ